MRKTRIRSRNRDTMSFYFLIAPFLAMFLFLRLYPVLKGIWLSFTNFSGFNYGSEKYIGAQNYLRVFKDNDAVYSFIRTIEIGLIIVPLSLIFGLVLALLLNKIRKGVSVFRTIYYLPSIIPVVAAGMMWKGIFQRNSGLINSILNMIGIQSQHWLGYDMVTTSLIIMVLWTSGSSLLINLAALKAVPIELYESSGIDGATPVQQFLKITFPMISPTIYFNLIMGVISTLQLFIQPVMLTESSPWSSQILNMPLRPNFTFLVHIYQQIFVGSRFGYGLALTWIIFIAIMIITLIIMKSSSHWVHYEVDQKAGSKNE